MFTQRFLIAVLVLVAATIPASAGLCTNPCTGSSATGADSTDRNNFNSDNSDLSFNNITFDNATGTYTAAGGLNATTAPSALLYGVTFIGCLSSQTVCASNSSGVTVGNLTFPGIWDGGTDPVLQVNSGNQGGGNYDTYTITFPTGTYAFALDLLNQNGFNTPAAYGLKVDNNSPMNSAGAVPLPGSVFFGYRSATPIGTVTIYSGFSNEQLALDNFEIGQQVATTAEVKTSLLVGTGLFTLLYVRRRKGLSPRAA
jgi:hypothetical protein